MLASVYKAAHPQLSSGPGVRERGPGVSLVAPPGQTCRPCVCVPGDGRSRVNLGSFVAGELAVPVRALALPIAH